MQRLDLIRAGVALATGLALCGCDEEPRPSVSRPTVQLAALRAGELTAIAGPRVAFDVPAGWSVRGDRSGKGASVAIVLPLRSDCEVFVQVVAERGTGARELKRRRKLVQLPARRRVEPNGDQVSSAIFDAPRGLVFGGGATGPGATAVLALSSPARGRPDIFVTAQGGTDGFACGDDDAIRARGLSVDALTRIGDSLRYE